MPGIKPRGAQERENGERQRPIGEGNAPSQLAAGKGDGGERSGAGRNHEREIVHGHQQPRQRPQTQIHLPLLSKDRGEEDGEEQRAREKYDSAHFNLDRATGSLSR